jgi:hypothetical protein
MCCSCSPLLLFYLRKPPEARNARVECGVAVSRAPQNTLTRKIGTFSFLLPPTSCRPTITRSGNDGLVSEIRRTMLSVQVLICSQYHKKITRCALGGSRRSAPCTDLSRPCLECCLGRGTTDLFSIVRCYFIIFWHLGTWKTASNIRSDEE